MQLAIVLFPDVTALDVVGPCEVLHRLPGLSVVFVGFEAGIVHTDGPVGLVADATFADAPRPDLILVPGGPGVDRLREDPRFVEWLRAAHPTTRYTASVCTGALALGAAGLLDGLTATTHWGQLDVLADFGAVPTSERIVEHLPERIITAAGVSAGIDLGLRLCELLEDATAAQAMQLLVEYDPQPPHRYLAPAEVPADVLDRLIQYATPGS